MQTPDRITTVAYDLNTFSDRVDSDEDCQNTLAQMLIAASTEPAVMRRSGCTVAEGAWLDPYTGRTFYDAADVQIDQLVPLA